MDDPLLVGVLHGTADVDEELEPLADRELLLSQYSVIGMPRTNSMTK